MKAINFIFSIVVYIIFTTAILPMFVPGDSQNYGQSPVTQSIYFFIYGIFLLLNYKHIGDALFLLKDNLALTLLSFLIIASSLWSSVPDISIRRSLAYCLTILLGLIWASHYNLKEIIKIAFISCSIIVLISYIVIFLFPSIGTMQNWFNYGQWKGAFNNKNIFGYNMAYSAIISLFFISISSAIKQKFFGFFIFLLSLVALFNSDSKTSLIAMTGTLLVIFWLRFRRRIKINLFISLSSFLIAILVLAIHFTNLNSILHLLNRSNNLTGRTEIWRQSINYITIHPILGYGYQSFWQISGAGEPIYQFLGFTFPDAHNGLLDILLQIGLIGLSIFLLFFLKGIYNTYKIALISKKFYSFFSVTIIIACIFFNISETYVLTQNSTYWALLIYAVCRSQIGLRYIKNPKLLQSQKLSLKKSLQFES